MFENFTADLVEVMMIPNSAPQAQCLVFKNFNIKKT